MTIQINWGSPQQDIIHLTFQPGWTWDHLKQAIQQADAMIGTVEHTVHLIIDLRGGGVPRDFMSLAGEVFAEGTARPNEGQRVVIGAGLLIRAAYRSLTAVYGVQLANRPFLFASTIDEARALLS